MNDEIINWLKLQPIWLQLAASRYLTNGTFADGDIKDFIQSIKDTENSKKIRVGYPVIGKTDNKNNIKLHSLGSIEGIDRLNPKRPLIFRPENLTVIYGSNGSGKSGYVRLIKNICGKPNTNPLKSNVYDSPPIKQSCVIKFEVNGITSDDFEWVANTQPIPELSNVDIFDATNGNIYLEKETETTYLPDELALFTELANISDKISNELDIECSKLVSSLPKLPDKYLSTVFGNVYTTLYFNTPKEKIDQLVVFSSVDEISLKTLKNRLVTLDPITEAKRKRGIKNQIDKMIVNINDAVNTLSPQTIFEIKLKYQNILQKRNAVSEGARILSGTAKLDGIGSDTWIQLWSAARAYSTTTAYKDEVFPYIGKTARCVLCHQELNDEAKERLKNFEEFVQGELETEAQKAEKEFEDAILNLPEILNETTLTTKCQAAELNEVLTTEINNWFSKTNEYLEILLTKKIEKLNKIEIPSAETLLKELNRLSNEAGSSAQQYEQDSSDFDHDKLESELLELEAHQWIAQQKEAIEAEIIHLKEIEKYKEWKKLTDTSRISREASLISEKLISEAYINRFNTELKKLGAENIAVQIEKSRATKGKSKYKISLKNIVNTQIEPIHILSDGEKRIVSLAAFLADVTSYTASTPFIFDDPISSLDQEFEEKTIERLVELSKERQVIVFTHRLSFLSIMLDKTDKVGINQNSIYIRNEPWGTGNPSEIPIFAKDPKGALNTLKNERLNKAKKEYNLNGHEAYYPLGKAICSDFRIILERVVEKLLFSGIILRFRRDVQTKQLSELLKITETDCGIIDRLMTKYSFYEHSQPQESPVPIPEPSEITLDLDEMLNWSTEFSKRG
jgi:energy-coupling factor transporter ATP-binding protein EcfA2